MKRRLPQSIKLYHFTCKRKNHLSKCYLPNWEIGNTYLPSFSILNGVLSSDTEQIQMSSLLNIF